MREHRISLRGRECRVEWTGIDSEQHIALLDIGAVLEITRNNLSAYLCLHLYRFCRGACANFIQVQRNIFGDNFCHCHRPRRWWRRCFLPACNDANGRKNNQDHDNTTYEINAFTAITSFKVCDTPARPVMSVSPLRQSFPSLFPFLTGE